VAEFEKMKVGNGNGGATFVSISNKDIWLKIIDLEKKVDLMAVKLYSFAAAAAVIGGFLALTGGVSVG
jgi:hypothetical protein